MNSKPENKSAASSEESVSQSGSDHMLDWMKLNGIPLTLSNYLGLCYPGQKMTLEKLDPEQIAEIPKQLMRNHESEK